ncbi:MAG: hypothetical protein NTU95_04175 [Methanothrix sp.]|nr:hypothetical protein [Methanothrix sp.]
MILAASVFASITSVVEISKQLTQTRAAARRLFLLLDEQPAVREESDEAPPGPVEPIEPSIALQDVSFRYSPVGAAGHKHPQLRDTGGLYGGFGGNGRSGKDIAGRKRAARLSPAGAARAVLCGLPGCL